VNSPTAALCIIGTEVVRGIIQDGHARLLSAELSSLGVDVRRIICLPDDEEIARVLNELVGSCDIVLTTGGLGPTSDDITRDAVAQACRRPLAEHQEAKRMLAERMMRDPSVENLRQVLIPEGFTVIPNPNGTAPGFMGYSAAARNAVRTLCISLPGPPREMQPMLYSHVIPTLEGELRLVSSAGRTEASVFLIPESVLEGICRAAAPPGVQWGTRIQPLKISLYLKGADEQTRREMLEELGRRAGPELVCEGELQPYDRLIFGLKESGSRISGAESCTGGYAAKLLTDLPGSSDYFWGGVTAYHNGAKMKLLGVEQEILERFGAVSRETALQMAEGMRLRADTDFSFSITGIAGPEGGTPEKPAGTVWFGFASKQNPSQAVRLNFHPYSRDSVRRRAAAAACLLLDAYQRGGRLLDIVSEWQYI
jgi:nicotinamide-nucleotide amidase